MKMNINMLNDTPPWEWPEDAGEILSKVFLDKNAPAPDRLLAAELAGDNVVMDNDMAHRLLSIVKDTSESEELRSTAAVSFGAGLEYAEMMDFDDYGGEGDLLTEEVFNEIQETFRILYYDADTPKIVRRRILEGSVRGSAEWHKEAVREAYSLDDTEWHITAVFCMGYVRGFEDKIMESLESENPEVLYEAVQSAGHWGIKDAWPYIKELLLKEDIDKWLLIAAIEAAATVNPEESVEFLTDLENSEDEDIADAAEDALLNAGMLVDDFDDNDFDDDEY
jgi:HEAT repeat protein